MNKLFVTSLLALSSVFSVVSHAQGQPYVGVKMGEFNLTVDKNQDFANAFRYGVQAGYAFNKSVSFELEYLTSGDEPIKSAFDIDKHKVSSLAGYLAYRGFMTDSFFTKLKAGYVKLDALENESATAYGLGLGYQVSPNIAVETEYNILPNIGIELFDWITDEWTAGITYKF